jgi:BASS family bile acid:Na+ symporter
VTGLGTRFLFPTVIAFVMFGLGMSLTPSAFGNVLRTPKAVLVGLAGQLVLLPLLALFLALVLPVAEPIRIGLVVLAACPGGATSNAIVFALGGETALSVTLTAVSSVITILTLPWVVTLGVELISGEAGRLALPAGSMVVRLATMTALPIVLGMTLRGLAPEFCLAARRPFRILSLLLVLAIVAISVRDALGLLREDALETFLATLALASLVVPGAWLLSRFAGLRAGERTAIAVEVGVQNTPLALLVGAMLVGMPELGITPVSYGLLNYLFVAVLLTWLRRRGGGPAAG